MGYHVSYWGTMSLEDIKKRLQYARNPRQVIYDLLPELTQKQQDFFMRLYKDVESILDDDIPHAIRQIKKTIELNEGKK